MMFDDAFQHEREPLQIGWRYGVAPVAAPAITVDERKFMQLSPELLFTSDCFQAVYARKRVTVAKLPLTSALPYVAACYSGERLDQFDLDVLLACVKYTLRNVSGDRMVKILLRDLAQEVSRKASGAVLPRVRSSLRRLESGSLHVSNRRYECLFSFLQQVMINRDDGLCLVAVHPMLLESLNAVPRLEMNIRDRGALPMDGLLRWLHALMLCGSEMCIPQTMMPMLSGARSLSRRKVESAMHALEAVGCRHYLGLTDAQELFLCLR